MAASASNKHSFLNSLLIEIGGQDASWLRSLLLDNPELWGYSDISITELTSSYLVKMEFLDRPLKWGWFMTEFAWSNIQTNGRKPQYEVLEWDRFEVTGPDLGDEADNVTLL